LSLEFVWGTDVSATTGCVRLTVKAYDAGDLWREEGPLLYHQADVPAKGERPRMQAIIRALTEITRQALEAYQPR